MITSGSNVIDHQPHASIDHLNARIDMLTQDRSEKEVSGTEQQHALKPQPLPAGAPGITNARRSAMAGAAAHTAFYSQRSAELLEEGLNP